MDNVHKYQSQLSIWVIPATSVIFFLSISGNYGIFRDELYYLACSDHLAWGYVDHPPLVAWLTYLSRQVLGDSVLAFRVLPALAGGINIWIAGMMVREWNRSLFSQFLAQIATFLAPIYLSLFSFLSMNAYDVLCWSGLAWVLIRIFKENDQKLWLLFGIIAGIGLMNKISVLFWGFGLVLGLLISRQWHHFRQPWIWLGGLIAVVIFLPHIFWQIAHDWPTLEFMRNATLYKNADIPPMTFILEQFLLSGFQNLILWIPGLIGLLIHSRLKPYRPLGWAFVVILVVMLLTNAKPYYLGAVYTYLFAVGAVLWGEWTASKKGKWVRGLLLLTACIGLLFAPLAVPVLPIETYIHYSDAIGIEPENAERSELGVLPQHFADRFGWEELARDVEKVYQELPPEEQASTCVFSQNYGQAGAMDYYQQKYDLPDAISGHNSYFLWGPGNCNHDVLIVIGDERERLEELFEEVELATIHTCEYCMPYENNKSIWIVRMPKIDVLENWEEIKSFL